MIADIDQWEADQLAASARRNPIVRRAVDDGRKYITPEDVTRIVRKHGVKKARLWFLRVLGKIDRAGIEDRSLCAFVLTKRGRDYGRATSHE